MITRIGLPVLLGLLMSLIAGAVLAREAAPSEPVRAVVSIPPMAYLVERIGGPEVQVQMLLGKGQDPHAVEFTPRQVRQLSKADIFFKIGLPLEDRLIESLARQDFRKLVVDVSRGVDLEASHDEGHDAHDHHCSHGHACAHDNGLDLHIWLSPPLLKTQAKNIAAGLKKIDKDHAAQYDENLRDLLQEIDFTHRQISAATENYRGQSFYVYHAAFGHFGKAYGLRQKPIEAGGRPPTPRQLRELIHKAKAEKVRIIFIQPQFDSRSAQTVARVLGGVVVPIDPLAKDVIENLRRIAKAIVGDVQDRENMANVVAP